MSERRPVPSKRSRSADRTGIDWIGLREAEELTGVPASTIRNWARKGRVRSRLHDDPSGARRWVASADVVGRARALGRYSPPSTPPRTPDPPSRVVPPSKAPPVLTEPSPARRRPAEAAAPLAPTQQAPAVASNIPSAPEDAMIVPLDAWNKMLRQLGHLHEAGQQLAEARERAAKAETEATFLRERLTEMRTRLAAAEAAAAGAEAEPPSQPPPAEPPRRAGPSGRSRPRVVIPLPRWRRILGR